MLEQRNVPFTTAFNAGSLAVTATVANEGLAVTVNGGGSVLVNGTATAFLAANVTSLEVRGEATGANNINLSEVTEAGFAALASVSVVGGTGNDTIVGSEFADTVSRGFLALFRTASQSARLRGLQSISTSMGFRDAQASRTCYEHLNSDLRLPPLNRVSYFD
jgi:hypothetical protein